MAAGAGLKRMLAFPLLLFFLFSLSLLYSAEGHRKISPSKLPSRVLMSAQSSSPNFYNAFDPSFQNPGSMYTTTLNNRDSVNFNDNIHNDDHPFPYKDGTNKDSVNFNDDFHKDDNPFTYKDSTNKGLSSNNYAFYPHTYNSNENFADPTSDYKANRGKYSYPTSSSYGGQKFPASSEESFPNKESNIGKESSSSNEKQGLYSTPSGEKSLYASPSNEKSWYTSPSSEQNLYASSSKEQSLHSSSPSNYKANYPFNANDSPSTSKVSDLKFDEFAKSHPVSNYDRYFDHPTVNENLVHTSSRGRPTFPSSDHDLTYGQVQVP